MSTKIPSALMPGSNRKIHFLSKYDLWDHAYELLAIYIHKNKTGNIGIEKLVGGLWLGLKVEGWTGDCSW